MFSAVARDTVGVLEKYALHISPTTVQNREIAQKALCASLP